MNRAQYAEYLKSPHWQVLKIKCIGKYGRICCLCKDRDQRVEIHHLTYRDVYDVQPEDLRPLCSTCHAQMHAKTPFWFANLSLLERFKHLERKMGRRRVFR